jgi:ferredoxin
MSLTVTVDDDLCMAAMRCVELAPDAFALNDDGIAEATVTTAVRRCPSTTFAYLPSLVSVAAPRCAIISWSILR